jgi:hypothetical protein
LSSVEKYAFPADTQSTSTAMSEVRDAAGGVSHLDTAGYVISGSNNSSGVNTIFKLTYSGETWSTLSATAGTSINVPGCFSDDKVGGYFSTSTAATTMRKLHFPTETVSVTTSLTTARIWAVGFGNAS